MTGGSFFRVGARCVSQTIVACHLPTHLFHRLESDGDLEEDQDHRHRQECVSEASESGCKFVHLFASVALIRMEDPERAGPIPKGLSLSSSSWSIRQLSANGAWVRPGSRHTESSVGDLGCQPECQSAHSRNNGVLDASLGRSFLPSCTAALVPKGGTRLPRRVVSQGSDTYARRRGSVFR